MRAVIEHITTEDPFGRGHSEHYRSISSVEGALTVFEFKKLVGGMSWPYEEYPGFCVVLALELNTDSTGRDFPCRVLKEYENDDIMSLILQASEYRKAYQADPWYTDTSDRHSMLQFIERMNQSKAKGIMQNTFHVDDAPYIDDAHNLQFYASMIKTRLKPTYKTLYFGKDSKLPAYIGALTEEQVTKRKAKEFPAVAALGYALAGMEMWQGGDMRNMTRIQDEYFKQYEVEGL